MNEKWRLNTYLYFFFSFIKFLHICASKGTIKKGKELKDGRKSLQIIHSIRNLYLEYVKNPYNLIKHTLKWAKDMNKHFFKEDTQMDTKHIFFKYLKVF